MGSALRVFIWTEIFNCGKIGKIALKSFTKHHPGVEIYVYGFEDDFKYIELTDFIIPVIIKKVAIVDKILKYLPKKLIELYFNKYLSYNSLVDGFRNGHLGTARLWAYIIKKRKEKFLIHFDSDVIFLENIMDDIKNLGKIYDLVGPIRNYKMNPNNIPFFEQFENLSSTYCFGFNREKIGKFTYKELIDLCIGRYKFHPVLDFFDPIMFTMIKNNAKLYFLNQDDVGGCDINGQRVNKYFEINNYNTPFKIDFGKKLIHFSAVGSGMNIYNNQVNISKEYSEYAVDRYALFCKIFYNEDLGIDLTAYSKLIDFFKKLEF